MIWKTVADSTSKKMTKCNRLTFSPLWAGLLIFGSLASTSADAIEGTDELSVRVDDGLVSLTAHNVPVQDIIQAIVAQYDLRLVQHVSLDRIITLRVEKQPLPDVLGDILRNDSYQLYLATSSDEDVATDNAVPGTLWIFAEGSALAPAATVFFEAVLYQGSVTEKQEAIRELRRLGTPVAVQALSLALADENERVRDSAFEALENIGSDEALGAIASAAMDSDPWVRSEAATALASGDSETSAEYLAIALDDPDPRVRMSVVEALADVPWGAMPSQQAVAALNRALKDENPEVRMKAIDSLEEIGGDIAFQALMRAKMDQDSDVADAASESLSSLDKQN